MTLLGWGGGHDTLWIRAQRYKTNRSNGFRVISNTPPWARNGRFPRISAGKNVRRDTPLPRRRFPKSLATRYRRDHDGEVRFAPGRRVRTHDDRSFVDAR